MKLNKSSIIQVAGPHPLMLWSEKRLRRRLTLRVFEEVTGGVMLSWCRRNSSFRLSMDMDQTLRYWTLIPHTAYYVLLLKPTILERFAAQLYKPICTNGISLSLNPGSFFH